MMSTRSPVLRTLVIGAVLAFALVMVLPTGAVTPLGAVSAESSHSALASFAPRISESALGVSASSIVRALIPNSGGISYLAGNGTEAVFGYFLANGSSELAEFNGTTGAITDLQDLGGGYTSYQNGVVWTGSEYLISDYNTTLGMTTFETYTDLAGLHTVTLPVSASIAWTLPGVTGGRLYLFGGGMLVALNAGTLAHVKTYSSILPTGTIIESVAAEDGRVYFGGSITPAGAGTYAFYGYITLHSALLTQLSPRASYPSDITTAVISVVTLHNQVYFGGETVVFSTSPTFVYYTTGAILLIYHPSTHAMTNLSGLLPSNTSVDQLLPMGNDVGIAAPDYNLTLGEDVIPHFFVLHGGTSLTNKTGVVGIHLGVYAVQYVVSSGHLIASGFDLKNDSATILESIPTSRLV